MNSKNKGFVLFIVLILFLVLLILGIGGAFITQMGYFSISSEAKYQVAEKNADKGLISVFESGICSDIEEDGFRVKAIKDSENNNCFVWSEGRYLGAKVVKVSVFSLKASNWGTAVYKKLNNLSGIGGNAGIIGYDSPENSCNDPNSCISHALVTGNQLDPKNIVITCNTNPNNLGSGLISYNISPYVYDDTLSNKDLTSMLFNAENRIALLQSLSEIFQVKFEEGKPTGLINPEISLNENSCDATGSIITCENNKKFTWDPNRNAYLYNKDNNYYSKIDLGEDAEITFDNFSGGGYIGGKNIKFNGGKASQQPLVLVARNRIDISQNNINIYETFMFSQNYNIDAKNLIIGNGIIYSGGKGVGNLNINVNSNTQLGTIETNTKPRNIKPILIISDNNLRIARNGNADIWGIIFVTDANNNFKVGDGNGDFKIHGIVISNSLNNNEINLKGNFEIRFNFKVLERLYTYLNQLNWNFLKLPTCGSSKKNLFITTAVKAY